MIRLLAFLPRRWWSPQAWKTWKSYMHWRMETYGVYYPDGKKNDTTFRMMMRQFPSYYRWLGDLTRLRRPK